MTQELKLVLCTEPTSIRDIVVAAQLKIIQHMLTNIIGISGFTVWWGFRKKNILIHEELPGKLKMAYSPTTLQISLHLCWWKFSTCWGIYRDVYPLLPVSYFLLNVVCFTLIRFPHMWQENTPSTFLIHENKRSAILVQNRNLSPWISPTTCSGYCWNAKRSSTVHCSNIFCIMWKRTSVCLKPNSSLILLLWDAGY